MGSSGILNLNKPQGVTSFAMVSLVRRLTGERRVGHAGTLDPLASGVLPILLGQGTRMMEFISLQPKRYRATIRLGVSTDTGDSEGAVVSEGDCSAVSAETLEAALATFKGSIQQIPPMYSALKHKGEPLYRLARQGLSVPRAARTAHIWSLDLLSWQPPSATVELDCSKGTYVRSLAMDLGDKLGCGAHLTSLARLRSAFLTLEDAISPADLEEAVRLECWRELLYPVDEAVLDFTAVIVGQSTEQAIRTGRPLDRQAVPPGEPGTWCRAYSLAGGLISLLRFQPEAEVWHPDRVFPVETG
ncbi:MAG: tRNA pseudouridine(55) synthase TruB [Dehalococcoidia bacterium]|nr:tRNA pseudouridine(55) synthase TruB [Dehalococcoidia bacterium]